MSLKQCQHIHDTLSTYARTKGLEVHMFNISWYNEIVNSKFILPYRPDTLAFIIISRPSMFEKCFVPYVNDIWTDVENEVNQSIHNTKFTTTCQTSKYDDGQEENSEKFALNDQYKSEPNHEEMCQLLLEKIRQDPLDQCMQYVFKQMTFLLKDYKVVPIHDYEMTPTRRPKILVQTAGHVAGAVCMYRSEDMDGCNDLWPGNKKVFPVCLHPEFGGWFALRGVLVLPDLTCLELKPPPQRDILTNKDQVLELLKRYNENWQDYSFRDIIPVKERYSDQQKRYFSTLPKDRAALLFNLIKNYRKSINNCCLLNDTKKEVVCDVV